jgi:hypothetical protein
MKNRIAALLVPLLLLASTASAQVLVWRSQPLQFVHTGNPPAAFPSGTSPTFQNGGTVLTDAAGGGVLQGTYPAINKQRDTTQAIDLSDHFLKATGAFRGGLWVAGDTTATFGVLQLQGSTGTVDSIVVTRDASLDGVNWSVVDSIMYHRGAASTTGFAVADGDSLGIKLNSISDPLGNSLGKGSIWWSAAPLQTLSGVTAQAIMDFRYIRFRISASNSDLNAGGSVTGSFSYPAVAYPYNR